MRFDRTPVRPQDPEQVLRRVQEIRKQQADLTQEYEDLRPHAVEAIPGEMYFIGSDGKKYRATQGGGDTTIYAIELMEQELPPEVFDEVTTRKVNGEALARARQAGRITDEQLLRYVSYEPKTKFPKIDPADRAPYGAT